MKQKKMYLTIAIASIFVITSNAAVTLVGSNFNSTTFGKVGDLSADAPSGPPNLVISGEYGLVLDFYSASNAFGPKIFSNVNVPANLMITNANAGITLKTEISSPIIVDSGSDLILQTHRPNESAPAGPNNEPGDVVVNATKNIINADVEVNGGLLVNGSSVIVTSGYGDQTISAGSNNTLGSSTRSIIYGSNNVAAEMYNSFVLGDNNNTVYQSNSLIVGNNNEHLNDPFSNGGIVSSNSMSIGTFLQTYSSNSLVVGQYNDPTTLNSGLTFSVGNGTTTERSNAFEVYQDGTVKVEENVEVGSSLSLGKDIFLGSNIVDGGGSNNIVVGKDNNIIASNSLIVGTNNDISLSGNVALMGTGLRMPQYASESVVIGTYNDHTVTPIFSVGNGTGPATADRSNALEVHQDGKVVMTGDVILEKVQGDISMGIFGE